MAKILIELPDEINASIHKSHTITPDYIESVAKCIETGKYLKNQDVIVSYIDAETGQYDEMLVLNQDINTPVGKAVFDATFQRLCLKHKIMPAKILAVKANDL